MAVENNFAVFILTHQRADKQITYKMLLDAGYSGKVYFIVDDMDPQKDQYIEKYGDQVIVFSKREARKLFDTMTSKEDWRSVAYARNACYGIARKLGLRFVLTCDDDISSVKIRLLDGQKLGSYNIYDIDSLFNAMVDLMKCDNMGALGLAHSGMYIGGANDKYLKGFRTDVGAMFIIDTEKPIQARGILNEDLHIAVDGGLLGKAVLTTTLISIQSPKRATNAGGLHDLYKDNSQYIRAFYSVMAFPGAFRVRWLNGEFDVHRIKNSYVPMILDERWKKK